VSLKLTALVWTSIRHWFARHTARIAEAARTSAMTVTIDMEDHSRTDATLAAVMALREEFPDVGAVVQAYLRRTEADCRELATRVRGCGCARARTPKTGGGRFQSRSDVDDSYARCLRLLMAGPGFPMVATTTRS